MAQGGIGWFHADYWHLNYWHEDYWAEGGAGGGGEVAVGFRYSRLMTQRW